MSTDLISTIVPIYNVEDYLAECLDSILAQTFHNIEIILVDDGSTDRSGIICDEYSAKDKRIQVIHKENGGLSSARNTGIENAKGEYLCFIDSDDFIHPAFIDTLYKACICNNCKIALCNICDENFPDEVLPSSLPIKLYNSHELLDAFYGIHHNTITVAWNKLYHRSVLGNYRYPEGLVYEDEGTTFAYLYNADLIAWVQQPLYHYRNRSGSITKRSFSLKRLDVLQAYTRRRTFYLEHGESDYASREEYCYLSGLLNFYHLLGKHMPDEKLKRKELLQEYRKCYSEYDKKKWGFRRRIFYAISLIVPNLYGTMKKHS